MIYNQDNFHKETMANFVLAPAPNREPDYISYAKSWEYPECVHEEWGWQVLDCGIDKDLYLTRRISSRYWYTRNGVYRESDHWGSVASCWWQLIDESGHEIDDGFLQTGFCLFSNFLANPPYDWEEDEEYICPSIKLVKHFEQQIINRNKELAKNNLLLRNPVIYYNGENKVYCF